MMELGKLTTDEMEFLENSLKSNTGMTKEEYQILEKKHPYAVMRKDNALILSSMKHYGQHDDKLNNFILNRFGKKDYTIDFFYELIYNEGDYTNPHYDKGIVVQTTLVLLSEDFDGGLLYINNKDVQFKEKSMYINFEGYKDMHSVTRVDRGQRRVLVIMFNKKQNLL